MTHLYVPPRRFAGHLAWLNLAGYRTVMMSEVARFVAGEPFEGRVVALTFDDAYRDFCDHAEPLLRKFGMTATIFAPSAFLGNYNAWDEDVVGARSPLMSAADARRLAEAGFEIGSHTRTHPFLSRVPPEAVRQELAGSKRDLESVTGRPVTSLCYPYGDANPRVVAEARAAGYATACTVRRGYVRPGDDPLALARVKIAWNTYLPAFVWRLATDYETGRD